MVALGEQETNVTESKYSVLNEGFGGIKEVKILNKFNFLKQVTTICMSSSSKFRFKGI